MISAINICKAGIGSVRNSFLVLTAASVLLVSCTEYIAPTCIITEPANGQRFLNHESTTVKVTDVTTLGVGLVNESSVLLAGNMENYGGIDVETGFYVSSEPDAKSTGFKVNAGYNREEFIATVSDLVKDKKYYFCAYASTAFGTSYGVEWFFFPRDAYHGTVYDLDGNGY